MEDSCERVQSSGDNQDSFNSRTSQDKQDFDDEPSLPLRDFYPYIRCALCTGFFIDATTITECLHTFCKSCIVKHFFYSNRCPNCDIVVHQTQPLYNIRPDRQLQDIVYKMVPTLEEAERRRMSEFYEERGLLVPKSVAISNTMLPTKPQKQKQKDLTPQSVFTIPPELDVSLKLEFVGAEEGIENYKPLERKYVRVSGEATIRHVELFIRRKMELSPDLKVLLCLNVLGVVHLGVIHLEEKEDALALTDYLKQYHFLLYRLNHVKLENNVAVLKVDVVCGEQLLEQRQSLREVQNTMGKKFLQDGMLVLQFGLVLPAQ